MPEQNDECGEYGPIGNEPAGGQGCVKTADLPNGLNPEDMRWADG
jgi:hypothetical protein